MKKSPDFRKLNWPERLNLHLISDHVDAKTFIQIIKAGGPNKLVAERRITLPSWTIFRKCLAHHIWKRVLDGKTSWKKAKQDLVKELGLKSLKSIGFSKTKVEAFYRQREKEIAEEQERK